MADKCRWCSHPYVRAQEPIEGYCSRKCYVEDPNSVDIRASVIQQRLVEMTALIVFGLLVAAFFMTR